MLIILINSKILENVTVKKKKRTCSKYNYLDTHLKLQNMVHNQTVYLVACWFYTQIVKTNVNIRNILIMSL